MNPLAGGGRAERIYADVSRLLAKAGLPHRIEFSRNAQHLSELAAAAAEEEYEGIAVLGGDGSASMVARGLILSGRRMPLAVIPCGSGNDWSRTLHTQDIGASVDAIVSRRTALLDAGRLTLAEGDEGGSCSTTFINSAGLGLDAHVLQRSLKLRKRLPFGRAAYLSALVSTLAELPLWEGSLEVDGEVVFEGKYLSLTVGVCRFVGGGMMLSPASRPDDGELDATVVLPVSRRKLVRSLPQVYRGTLIDNPSVLSWRGMRILFRSVSGISLELDGESVDIDKDSGEILMESLPGVMEAVVGKGYGAPGSAIDT